MAGMTNAHEAECLNHMVAGTEFTYGTTNYLCFFSADPTEAGTLTNEIDYGAANRPETISYKSAVSGRADNNAIATINTTGWDGVAITHFGISKGITRGTDPINWFGAVTTINYTPGDTLTLAADALFATFYDGPQTGTAANLIITDVGANKWLDHSLGVTRWIVTNPVDQSLHTAAPATAVNEFSGGAGPYARQGWTAGTVGAGGGDYQQISHTNNLTFNGMPATTLRSWGLFQGADLIFIRDEGSDRSVNAGSTIDATAGTIIARVD